MRNNSDDNLEKLIHQELVKLPELQAPASLIPRVLKALQIQARKPWWQRSWFYWPFGMRAVSLAFSVALVALTFLGIASLWQDLAHVVAFDALRDWLAPFAVAGDIINTLGSAVLLILNAIGRFWLLLSLGVAFMTYVSCVGLGTVCFRLATNKR